MSYYFTSESVSEGHPDKVSDQISDALLDNFLAFDPSSKVACETLVTTGQIVLAGEVKSDTYVDLQQVARDVVNKIGYTKAELTELKNDQAEYIGVTVEGPYKPDYYRY
jgi:S-adenosylmethionine synthetase